MTYQAAQDFLTIATVLIPTAWFMGLTGYGLVAGLVRPAELITEPTVEPAVEPTEPVVEPYNEPAEEPIEPITASLYSIRELKAIAKQIRAERGHTPECLKGYGHMTKGQLAQALAEALYEVSNGV